MEPKSRKNNYISVVTAQCRSGRVRRICCNPQLLQAMWHWFYVPWKGVIHPQTHSKPCPGARRRTVHHWLGSRRAQSHWCHWAGMQSPAASARMRWEGQGKTTPWSPPGNTGGLPGVPAGRPAGGHLHDTSSCAQSAHTAVVLNDLFTPSKNLEHQQVLYRWPDQTAIRYQARAALSNAISSPGWIILPWKPTNPMIILWFTTDISHPKTWTCWNIQSCSGTHAKKSPWQQRRQLANGSCCTHTQN